MHSLLKIFFQLNYITFIIICGIIKIMKVLKKFWMALIAMMPISAGAVGPFLWGTMAVGVGIIGVSIWRTVSPVDMKEALSVFSSCWTCQMFSDIMISMSSLLPGVYRAMGHIVIPMSATLLAVLIAWRLCQSYLNGKQEEASKLLGNFGVYIAKLTLIIGLLLVPLPRLITSILI